MDYPQHELLQLLGQLYVETQRTRQFLIKLQETLHDKDNRIQELEQNVLKASTTRQVQEMMNESAGTGTDTSTVDEQ